MQCSFDRDVAHAKNERYQPERQGNLRESEARSAGSGGTHFGGVDAEAEARKIRLTKRHASCVQIAPDKEQQERDGGVVFVPDGVNNGKGEIKAEQYFRVGHPAGLVPVGFFRERALFAFDIKFWGTGKFAFFAEQRFDHCLRVANGNPDAGCHDEGHVEKRAPPGFGPQLSLRDEIEAGDGTSGGEEERQVDYQHLEPALIETHDHRGQQHGGKQNHQRVADVAGKVDEGFGFDVPGRIRLQDSGEDFFCLLHEALGPARLLCLEAVHVHGKLGSTLDLREIHKLPAFELRAIRQIGVFGKSVMLPAASIVNGFAAPHAGGAIEVEERAAAGARAVLDDEVSVEKNRFHVGQQGIIAVDIRPARLDHADFAAAIRIHEIGNGAAKKIGLGEKVGVEDGDEFALGLFQAVFQRPGFVAFAVGAVNVNDGHALGGMAFNACASNFAGFVGGVVQHLHFEQFRWIVESGNGFDEALDDVAFVEDGKLHGDPRPVCDRLRGRRHIFRVRKIVVDKPIAMEAVYRKDQKNDEIGKHHCEVESVGV